MFIKSQRLKFADYAIQVSLYAKIMIVKIPEIQ